MLTIQKNIIDELNAEWNDSEIHIIYGKSGCGKSYLAQEIIAQFQAEQSKNIAFIYKGILCVKIENIMHLRNVCLINLINIIRKSIIRN